MFQNIKPSFSLSERDNHLGVRQVWSCYLWREGDAAHYRCDIGALSAGKPTMAGEQSEIPRLRLEICQSADTWWDLNLGTIWEGKGE